MPITKVGLNLSNLQNLTPPSFDINYTGEEFIEKVPEKANEITQGFLGLIILWALWIWLYWKLSISDYQAGDFGFSKLRAAGLASTVCSILGIFMINVGWFVNYYHVALFMVITLICVLAVWKLET